MKKPNFMDNVRGNPAMFVFIAILIVGIGVLLTVVALSQPKEKPVFSCMTDQILGADLCGSVPFSIKEKMNVYITGGITTVPEITSFEGMKDTRVYALQTSAQQMEHLVSTPSLILNFEKLGTGLTFLLGLLSTPILFGVFKLTKGIIVRNLKRKERLSQRHPSVEDPTPVQA